MCHTEFLWEPNPCVNFVTGNNGSGKSSVLQGRCIFYSFYDKVDAIFSLLFRICTIFQSKKELLVSIIIKVRLVSFIC